MDSSNYRGTTLLSSLRKLFSSLIYNHIKNEIESKDILSPSQAGFRKNCRTTDHIFTLFSLLKKSISKGKYFYIRFVDFRKAYDSTCRKRLLYKLEETGLIGKILDIIKSIYKSPKGSLIHQEFIRQTFLTTISLKQGDVLSTILLNIYINDLSRRLLENSRSPDTVNDLPYLDDTKINNLLFADDLANFSLSKEELQKQISMLEQYSNEWGLELNLSKTKIMIFNKQGATIRKFKFYFQGQEIEIVKQYTYLGFTFIPSGKKHQGTENLINKAKKS